MSFQKTISSFNYALHGLTTTWKEERNFKIEIAAAIIVAAIALYFHFTFVESAFCCVTLVLVLGAELVNTAIEDICNKIEPRHDISIGKIKDIMAALVLINACGSLVIGILVFYHHFVA